ncbi:VOC family protein [Xanthobacter versatilis]|uniref:VOC family protein n=1 Tax=Xanthobacter autotrophicus (strain ATCC BAA-1158 / Py2) TaxID=78245 RepID=UPI00372C50A0
MNIIGPDALVFGVDDVAACATYLTDFGLQPTGDNLFEALDGTGIAIRHRSDAALPAAIETGNMLRQIIYGVADEATVDAIADELGKDRQVTRGGDGSIEAFDDHGFALKFQVSVRRPLDLPGERVNAPGAPAQRAPNERGVWQEMPAKPRTLSHVVCFVPDIDTAEAFYVQRLGFKVTDRLLNAGPFLRPAGTQDHHTLFFIQTPPFMQGCEHFAFHMGGPTELMLAGTRFAQAGYQSFWGPGRHKMGSNWFWYFNSPLGCHAEYDADMDLHDDEWVPRATPMSAEASQAFLFEYREKWAPGGPPSAGKPQGDAGGHAG